jgi:hypothetical protein
LVRLSGVVKVFIPEGEGLQAAGADRSRLGQRIVMAGLSAASGNGVPARVGCPGFRSALKSAPDATPTSPSLPAIRSNDQLGQVLQT